MAKYLLIAAIVISLATAVIGFVNHGTLTETKKTLEETKSTLAVTQRNLATTQNDLKTTKATLDTTEADKQRLTGELATVQSDLSTTKGQLEEANKASAEKDTKIADLESQVQKFQEAAGGGGDAINIEETIAKYNQRISELEAQVTSQAEKSKADAQIIATYKQQEEDRRTKQMQQGLEGRVLAVNPAWNFVVLSIGDKQGVVNNAELLLKRGGQYLGKVRITSVEPSTSIADIVANTLPAGVAVQPGDSVIFQANKE